MPIIPLMIAGRLAKPLAFSTFENAIGFSDDFTCCLELTIAKCFWNIVNVLSHRGGVGHDDKYRLPKGVYAYAELQLVIWRQDQPKHLNKVI
jgi:hypothetical protein